MATVARARHRYTYDEYLAYERDSGLKHEFDDGEILAMAGGSRRHNALALRMGAALEHTHGTVGLVTGAEVDLASLLEALPA